MVSVAQKEPIPYGSDRLGMILFSYPENIILGHPFQTRSKAWIEQELVDYLLLGLIGPAFPLNNLTNYQYDLTEAAKAARNTRTRVYPAFDGITFMRPNTEQYGHIEYMRAACLNYYRQGAHGAYYMNFEPSFPYLSEIGDPGVIERKDKKYVTNWWHEHEPQLLWSSDSEKEIEPCEVELTVGDALEGMAASGDLDRVTLKVGITLNTSYWRRNDEIESLLNNESISPLPPQKDQIVLDSNFGSVPGAPGLGYTRFVHFDLTGGPLPKMGRNVITVKRIKPDRTLTCKRELYVNVVELHVQYRQRWLYSV